MAATRTGGHGRDSAHCNARPTGPEPAAPICANLPLRCYWAGSGAQVPAVPGGEIPHSLFIFICFRIWNQAPSPAPDWCRTAKKTLTQNFPRYKVKIANHKGLNPKLGFRSVSAVSASNDCVQPWMHRCVIAGMCCGSFRTAGMEQPEWVWRRAKAIRTFLAKRVPG